MEINVIAPPKRVIALIAVAKKKKMMICNCAAEENSDIVNKPAEEASSLSGICPRCGKTSTGPHVFDKKTTTLHPSIVCNSINDNGIKCDYHGWLKNGIFTDV